MIVDERLVTYINSLDTGNTEILDEIEREALETYCLLYTSDAADE
mgnify:CR=1 FL=1